MTMALGRYPGLQSSGRQWKSLNVLAPASGARLWCLAMCALSCHLGLATEATSGLWWEGADAPRDADSGLVVQGWGDLACFEDGDTKPVHALDAVFENDLFVQTDLVLPGISSVQTITFTRPRLWELEEGSEIRLLVEHSSSLIPERSHLTVYVNEINLSSIRLDRSNASSTEFRIPLPVSALKDFNVLKLAVAQHYTDDCEDPFDPSLWTKVSRRSKLHFAFRCKRVNPDLAKYPLPIFDRQGYGPAVLNYVLPREPSRQTLDALGVITAALGREVSYGHLAIGQPVERLEDARGNLVLVGTVQENPEIARLLGTEVDLAQAGEGIVALLANPYNPYAAALVLSGRDPTGVLLAARTLASTRRHEVLSGSVSVVNLEIDLPVSELRAGPRLVPADRDEFTLQELGESDRTVRGFFASPVRIEVRALPDMQFYERRQTLHLHYSYGAQLEGRLSTLEVRWNNITLQSIPLTNPDGENDVRTEVNIPQAVMAPYNDVQFVFNLFPRGYDVCTTKTDRQLWGTLFADTGFTLPHYFWTRMPELGHLKYEMYPFGLYQDLSQTAIVLPDRPEVTDILAGLALAAELGRATAADRVGLTLARAGELSEAEKRDKHLIVIASRSPNSLLDTLRAQQLLHLVPGEKILKDTGEDVLRARDPNNFGTLEQILSPFGGSEKTITVVQGLTEAHLKDAIRLMTDMRLKSRLSGNIALAAGNGHLVSLDLGERANFGDKPMAVELQERGRDNYWLVILLLFVALFLIYLCLRYLLDVYRRRHHEEDDGPGGSGGKAGPHDRAEVVERHPRVVLPGNVTTTELVSAAESERPGGRSRETGGGAGNGAGKSGEGAGGGQGERRPQRRLPPRRTPGD